MSEASLPAHIDPLKWADRDAPFVASLPVQRFQRLLAGLPENAGAVQVTCRLRRDPRGLVLLTGELYADVVMTCQRCLDAVTIPVAADMSLFLLPDEELAERLDESEDYVVYDEGHCDLLAVLEDELILALPLVPRHDDCEPAVVLAEPETDVPVAQKENPFLVLAGLKRQDTGSE